MTWICETCGCMNSSDVRTCARCGRISPDPASAEAPTASSAEFPVDPFRDLPSGTMVAERYRIVEKLGEGSTGKVYKALDLKLEQGIVIKVIRPEIASAGGCLEEFEAAFPVLKRAEHTNLCRYFEFVIGDEFSFITMQHVSGEDLKTILRMTRRLSPSTAVETAIQICEGVNTVHDMGRLHRDLKPSNIMMDRTGRIHILDYGLAGFVEPDGSSGGRVMIGTPEYMSPEQLSGGTVDARSDVYAVGVILYEMVTGLLPHRGGITVDENGSSTRGEAVDPRHLNPAVSAELAGIILKCLSARKEDRFSDLKELRGALASAEKTLPHPRNGADAAQHSGRKRDTTFLLKRLLLISALFTAVLLFRAGLSVLLNRIPVPSPQPRSKMLAVLPFENLGREADDYFAEGLTEELTSRLSALHGLGVISRTSAAQYRDSQKTLRQIGEELGVDYILEGTVRWDRSPEGRGIVRFTPKLIRVSDDMPLWSQTFDRVIEDIFSVQSEIAENVIRSLDLAVLEPERLSVEARPTDNLQAYDLYLRARRMTGEAYEMRSRERFEETVRLLDRAVRLDPYFTYAYITLSEVHSLIYMSGIDRTMDRLERIRTSVERALELDPDLPDAKQALALYYYRGLMDYERALGIFEEVKRARPNVQPAAIGYILRRQGRWLDCLETLGQSFRLNPRNFEIAYEIGRTHMCLRQYDEARFWFDRSIQIEPGAFHPRLAKSLLPLLAEGNTADTRALLEELPSNQLVTFFLLELDRIEGRYDDALARLQEYSGEAFEDSNFFVPRDLALAGIHRARGRISLMRIHADRARIDLESLASENPGDPRYTMALGMACAYLGRYSEAVRASSRAVHLYPVGRDALDAPRYVLDSAVVYALLGDDNEAVRRLESLMTFPAGGLVSKSLLRIDPFWGPLRTDPDFLGLLGD